MVGDEIDPSTQLLKSLSVARGRCRLSSGESEIGTGKCTGLLPPKPSYHGALDNSVGTALCLRLEKNCSSLQFEEALYPPSVASTLSDAISQQHALEPPLALVESRPTCVCSLLGQDKKFLQVSKIGVTTTTSKYEALKKIGVDPQRSLLLSSIPAVGCSWFCFTTTDNQQKIILVCVRVDGSVHRSIGSEKPLTQADCVVVRKMLHCWRTHKPAHGALPWLVVLLKNFIEYPPDQICTFNAELLAEEGCCIELIELAREHSLCEPSVSCIGLFLKLCPRVAVQFCSLLPCILALNNDATDGAAVNSRLGIMAEIAANPANKSAVSAVAEKIISMVDRLIYITIAFPKGRLRASTIDYSICICLSIFPEMKHPLPTIGVSYQTTVLSQIVRRAVAAEFCNTSVFNLTAWILRRADSRGCLRSLECALTNCVSILTDRSSEEVSVRHLWAATCVVRAIERGWVCSTKAENFYLGVLHIARCTHACLQKYPHCENNGVMHLQLHKLASCCCILLCTMSREIIDECEVLQICQLFIPAKIFESSAILSTVFSLYTQWDILKGSSNPAVHDQQRYSVRAVLNLLVEVLKENELNVEFVLQSDVTENFCSARFYLECILVSTVALCGGSDEANTVLDMYMKQGCSVLKLAQMFHQHQVIDQLSRQCWCKSVAFKDTALCLCDSLPIRFNLVKDFVHLIVASDSTQTVSEDEAITTLRLCQSALTEYAPWTHATMSSPPHVVQYPEVAHCLLDFDEDVDIVLIPVIEFKSFCAIALGLDLEGGQPPIIKTVRKTMMATMQALGLCLRQSHSSRDSTCTLVTTVAGAQECMRHFYRLSNIHEAFSSACKLVRFWVKRWDADYGKSKLFQGLFFQDGVSVLGASKMRLNKVRKMALKTVSQVLLFVTFEEMKDIAAIRNSLDQCVWMLKESANYTMHEVVFVLSCLGFILQSNYGDRLSCNFIEDLLGVAQKMLRLISEYQASHKTVAFAIARICLWHRRLPSDKKFHVLLKNLQTFLLKETTRDSTEVRLLVCSLDALVQVDFSCCPLLRSSTALRRIIRSMMEHENYLRKSAAVSASSALLHAVHNCLPSEIRSVARELTQFTVRSTRSLSRFLQKGEQDMHISTAVSSLFEVACISINVDPRLSGFFYADDFLAITERALAFTKAVSIVEFITKMSEISDDIALLIMEQLLQTVLGLYYNKGEAGEVEKLVVKRYLQHILSNDRLLKYVRDRQIMYGVTIHVLSVVLDNDSIDA